MVKLSETVAEIRAALKQPRVALVALGVLGASHICCAVLGGVFGPYVQHIGERLRTDYTAETPNVVLGAGPNQIVFNNMGKEDIYLWGDKLATGPRTLESEPRTVPAGLSDHINIPRSQATGLIAGILPDQARVVPIEAYFKDKLGRGYTQRFAIRLFNEDGAVHMDPQNLGPMTREDWSAAD